MALLGICVVLAVLAVFCLFAAMAHLAYPQSKTTIEAYPTDRQPPSTNWPRILAWAGVGVLLAVAAASLYWHGFLPAHRLVEVEAATRESFRKELGREPTKMQFQEDRAGDGPRWKFSGVVWLNDQESWDVTVTWGPSGWECRGVRRD
jgi:hypothetical protein